MTTQRPRRWYLAFCLIASVLAATTAWAQSGRATVSGIVTDETGAVVDGVEVIATNQDTNVVTAASTNRSGRYTLLNLPVGPYAITFKKEGFTSQSREGFTVGVAQALNLDVTLTVGGLADTVTVTADASLLETGNAEIGTTMQSRIVTDLPLNISGGRALENFAYAVTPSVEGDNWTSRIAGSPTFSKEVVIDGTSAVIQIGGHIGESSPSMDAVEEFKVQTSGIPAEYGRTGGGVFNFSLKSGTNELHGTAYGYLRNEALNANTWQNGFLGEERSLDRQKIGGASLGGPIFKNKTFFFASAEEYQQTRFLLGAFDKTVPLPAFLDGDFSALLDRGTLLGQDAAGSPIYRGAIFDPRTGLVFPNNVIPQGRLSRVSRQIGDIYRSSYRPMLDRLTNNSANTFYNDPDFKQHQVSLKLDHNFSERSKLTSSFIWTQRPRTLVDQGGIWDPDDPGNMGGPLSKARRQEVGSRQFRLSHSQAFSSNTLHVANFTFSRYHNPSLAGAFDGDWGRKLGFADAEAGNFPEINFGDAVNGVDITDIGYNSNGEYTGETWIFNDSVNWVKGRHVFKFGGEVRHIVMDGPASPGLHSFWFDNDQTGMPGQPWSNQVGSGFASFMLGEAQRGSKSTSVDLHGHRNYLAFYAQDDFRVNSKLTLNLGLRWETTGPWTERNGRWANYDTRAVSPLTGRPGVLVYAQDGSTTFEGDRDWGQIGPRLGVAYQLTPRTVLRGSYGMFYTPIGSNYWFGVPYGFAPGFRDLNEVPQVGTRPAFNWDSGYPGVAQPGLTDPDQVLWGQVAINPESLKAGRIQQWNAGIDLGLSDNLVLGLNYLGNKGSGLPSGHLERNQPDMAALGNLLKAGKEWNWVFDEASARDAGVPYPYPGFANFSFFALQPFPRGAEGWGPIFFVGSPLGSSDYHAAQLTLTKRMSHGLAGSVSYTLSRSRSNTDTVFQETWDTGFLQDVTNLDQEAEVIDANDRMHILKGYVAWQLPFGKGRRFLNDARGLTQGLLGGWTVSALFRYHSGVPLRVTSNSYYAGWTDFGYPIYVNANPSGDFSGQFSGNFDQTNAASPGNRYFDPKAFSNPAYGEFGTGPGYFKQLRGFGAAYEDVGIMKNIAIGDRYNLQVRFELINVFNRHYYDDPETDIGSPLFGQVVSTTGSPRQGQLGIRFEF
jgi:hypothetical protein